MARARQFVPQRRVPSGFFTSSEMTDLRGPVGGDRGSCRQSPSIWTPTSKLHGHARARSLHEARTRPLPRRPRARLRWGPRKTLALGGYPPQTHHHESENTREGQMGYTGRAFSVGVRMNAVVRVSGPVLCPQPILYVHACRSFPLVGGGALCETRTVS